MALARIWGIFKKISPNSWLRQETELAKVQASSDYLEDLQQVRSGQFLWRPACCWLGLCYPTKERYRHTVEKLEREFQQIMWKTRTTDNLEIRVRGCDCPWLSSEIISLMRTGYRDVSEETCKEIRIRYRLEWVKTTSQLGNHEDHVI